MSAASHIVIFDPSVGRAALERHGTFWYPIRLIRALPNEAWRVQWWRGCRLATPGVEPSTVTDVLRSDVVDSLWMDRLGLPNIRVSVFHVSIDKSIQRHIGLAPFGHAITLFITSRLQNLDMEDEANLVRQAWEMQVVDVEELWYAVDIGKECLERLEEEMFGESEQAGIAGHRQWGLDAGDHQNGRDPHLGTPLGKSTGITKTVSAAIATASYR